jgi:hypothetical protein
MKRNVSKHTTSENHQISIEMGCKWEQRINKTTREKLTKWQLEVIIYLNITSNVNK